MNGEVINVLCSTDDNYAPYCGIMLTSLLENNRDCDFLVFVFLNGTLSKTNEDKFALLEKKYGCRICRMCVSPEISDKFIVNKNSGIDTHAWVTAATFFRLLAADLLPSDIHKVLYLDCDLVVNDSIRTLWDVDLKGKAFVGILDDNSDENCERLGYPTDDRYLNAGVAIYNLDYWREHDITAQFYEYMSDNRDKIILMDQDIINGTLHGRSVLLPERYNFMVTFFYKNCWNTFSDSYKENLIEESKHAAIIHFCGGIKPWDFRYFGSPFWTIWEKYRKMSLWRRSHITKPRAVYLKTLLKCLLFPKYIRKRRSLWVYSPYSWIV